jgi:hypothetical protein
MVESGSRATAPCTTTSYSWGASRWLCGRVGLYYHALQSLRFLHSSVGKVAHINKGLLPQGDPPLDYLSSINALNFISLEISTYPLKSVKLEDLVEET